MPPAPYAPPLAGRVGGLGVRERAAPREQPESRLGSQACLLAGDGVPQGLCAGEREDLVSDKVAHALVLRAHRAGRVPGEHHVRQIEQRRFGLWWFGPGHVQDGQHIGTLSGHRDQSRFIDDRTARGVEDTAPGRNRANRSAVIS